MNLAKRIAAAAAAAVLALSLHPAARADDSPARELSWDGIVEAFLAENAIPADKIALGYKNLVTGEEHFLNGDTYLLAASMFKVPLNMIYTDRIYRGEMTMDDPIRGAPYRYCLETTIVDSSNEMAYLLWNNLGNYTKYRDAVAPYVGEEPETVEPMFYKKTYFTARQMIFCLDLLYSEPERFSGIVEAMLRAEPNGYFKSKEQSVPVAHKYGYVRDSEGTGYRYINDCAIVYTDEPIAIVMFTASLPKAEERLAEYCEKMIEYTQTAAQARREAEKTPLPTEAPTPSPTPVPATATPIPTETPTPTSTPRSQSDAAEEKTETMLRAVLLTIFGITAVCAAVYLASKRRHTRKGERK